MKRSEFQQVVIATMDFCRRNRNAEAFPNKEICNAVARSLEGSLPIEEDREPLGSHKRSYKVKPMGLHKRTNYNR